MRNDAASAAHDDVGVRRSAPGSLTLSTLTSASMAARSSRCPICFAASPQDPFSTTCGHIFCYECLRRHLEVRRSCPQCREYATPESIVPAFLARPNAPGTATALTVGTASTPAISPTPAPTTPVVESSPRIGGPRHPATPTATSGAPPRGESTRSVSGAPATSGARAAGAHMGATAGAGGNADCTPDLTDALSSRRRSPPRITRHDTGAHSAKSPTATARRMRTLAAMDATMSSPRSLSSPSSDSPSATVATVAASAATGAGGAASAATGNSTGSQLPIASSFAAILNNDDMSPDQIAQLIAMLEKKKTEQVGGQRLVRSALLHDFLVKARSERRASIARLSSEVAVLDADIRTVESSRPATGSMRTTLSGLSPKSLRTATVSSGGHSNRSRAPEVPGLRAKRRRVVKNYDALKECYFSSVAHLKGGARLASLKKFTDDIVKVTQYSRFRCHASLLHVAKSYETPSNIVSSIEFDRESTLLATAGVTKRIKIFEFPTEVDSMTEVQFPVKEIPARAKLSWVCWNPYIRQQLVSSDYDGIVTLWDVHRGEMINEFEEHEKRAWSVDFCTADPRIFASGSDDGRVKIWTTSQNNSALTIGNGRANVCSVKFQPQSTYGIAFGSADHNVHYYDLRYIAQPVQVFTSHERTVSYVKFISPKELVSACVDSTIKLWDLGEMRLERTFTGHVNDKNFVGLTVNNDYIACGSEQNSIYAYYKAIPKPFAQYRFPKEDPVTGAETHDDDESFVSSVCWCPKNPSILVGANSLGIIKVLKLTDSDTETSGSDENSSV